MSYASLKQVLGILFLFSGSNLSKATLRKSGDKTAPPWSRFVKTLPLWRVEPFFQAMLLDRDSLTL